MLSLVHCPGNGLLLRNWEKQVDSGGIRLKLLCFVPVLLEVSKLSFKMKQVVEHCGEPGGVNECRKSLFYVDSLKIEGPIIHFKVTKEAKLEWN